MKRKETRQTTVRMPLDLSDRVDRVAGQLGMSMTSLINLAIGLGLNQIEQPVTTSGPAGEEKP